MLHLKEYKRRSLVFLLLLTGVFVCTAQGLADFNKERLDINRIGMYVLGAWAAGNIVVGSTAAFFTRDTARYFHVMNAAWNVVNISIAAAGLIGISGTDPGSLAFQETVTEQYNAEKAFLFNAGLDIGYIGFGLFLTALSREGKLTHLKRGFGWSLVLQGGFLFVFDLVMYFIQNSHGREVWMYL